MVGKIAGTAALLKNEQRRGGHMGRGGTKTDVLHLPGRAKDGAMLLQNFGTRVLEHFTVSILCRYFLN